MRNQVSSGDRDPPFILAGPSGLALRQCDALAPPNQQTVEERVKSRRSCRRKGTKSGARFPCNRHESAIISTDSMYFDAQP